MANGHKKVISLILTGGIDFTVTGGKYSFWNAFWVGAAIGKKYRIY